MAKQAKLTPVFDPNRNYKWEPSDAFDVSGQEFAALYHCLVQEMNTPGGAPVSLIAEAYTVILEILKRGVADGTIQEADSTDISQIDNNVKAMFKK